MHGVSAQATVTGVEDTGVYVNGSPRVKLTLQVQPEGVGAPFEVTRKLTADRFSLPVLGSQLWVKYDPDDTSKVEFDEAKNDETSVSATAAPTPMGPAGTPIANFTTSIPVGQTVIDARNVPGLREELLKAVADMQAGGNPAELQEAVAKAMSQGQALGMPPGVTVNPGAAGISPAGGVPAPGIPDPLDQLEKLNALRQSGALTQAEFDAQKAKILGET